MSLTVEAVYENGCLKLGQPLPFKEHEKVQVTVQSAERPTPPSLRHRGLEGQCGGAGQVAYRDRRRGDCMTLPTSPRTNTFSLMPTRSFITSALTPSLARPQTS